MKKIRVILNTILVSLVSFLTAAIFLTLIKGASWAQETFPVHVSTSPARIGELKRVSSVLEFASQGDPKNAEMTVLLGLIYYRLGEADNAQRMFEKTVSINPDDASAHFMLAILYEKKKELRLSVSGVINPSGALLWAASQSYEAYDITTALQLLARSFVKSLESIWPGGTG